MILSYDLISQFAKVTNDKPESNKETTAYGTIVKYNNSNYVKLDGSDLLTPYTSTITVEDGDRVLVTIKKHTATVTGSTSNPSANNKTVVQIGNKISEFEIIIADKVTAQDIEAVNGYFENIKAISAKYSELEAVTAEIETLQAKYAEMDHITAKDAEIINAEIESLQAKFAEFTQISTEDLEAVNAEFTNITAYNANFTYVSTEVLKAMKADIKDLNVKKLDAESANIKYANIDFSNINEAAVVKLFTDSGIIKDLIVQEGKITGELVGVTIKGDLIEGNTVKADKLVVLGEDGLYYKLNVNSLGEATASSDEKYQNGLDGSAIIAKSITADRVAVTDLVAFGATIGGFHITNNSLYSGVKESVDNTTTGVYLDKEGQIAIGDSNNFLKYFIDDEGNYKLEIQASSIKIGVSSTNVEEAINDVSTKTDENSTTITETNDNLNTKIAEAQAAIELLSSMISTLIVSEEYQLDENGDPVLDEEGNPIKVQNSLMTQNGSGWTFNMSDITGNLTAIQEAMAKVEENDEATNSALESLTDLINEVANKTAYITIATDENGNPCIELGKTDNDFKVRITNTAIDFLEGSSKIAYANNNTFYSKKIIVEEELQIGKGPGFVWKTRANGNMGLIYISE